MTEPERHMAPGAPGLPPTWCSSDKDLVGTAMGPARLWFTLGHGIVNEVYHPRIDIPQMRDLGFIVADDAGFWVEVKRLEEREILTPGPGIPLPTILHRHPRFTLNLRICPDPERDVLRLAVELDGDASLRPYVLLAPHLGGTGWGNQAWVGEHRGRRALWAEQGPFGLALLAVNSDYHDAFHACSAGIVGASDGWHDFARHGRLTWQYTQAGPGNVALVGELPRRAQLALGISTSRESAATLALASLTEAFEALCTHQTRAWSDWHAAREMRCPPPALPDELDRQLRLSAQVLKSHQDKTFTGAMVASLSVPWGNHGEERGGYHLVWPRDLVECAQSLLALGCETEARAVLTYLIATQHPDGHWHQNQWLGGKPYWEGIQLDESAFPVLLAASLAEADALAGAPVADMVRRALGFLIREGPASPQDRWEEDAGVNLFTVAVAIAALVAGAGFLPEAERALPLTVADFWNARLEDWCVATDTSLGVAHGVPAYYIRQAPPDVLASPKALHRVLTIKNLDRDPNLEASEQVGLEFLQLVRLGLRAASDTLIRDSVKLADALLATDTPSGRVWHRYNDDGYGEDAGGGAFDGTGHGRGWPLLVGERGHFALAAGKDALPYLHAMNAMAGSCGLIPEQVWDSAPLPDRGLYPGRPSGSAMPLAWAHAEFVKLAISLGQGRVSDRPAAVWARYAGHAPDPATWVWTPGAAISCLASGKDLLIVLPGPAILHYGFDGWREPVDQGTQDMGLRLHAVRIPAGDLAGNAVLDFTWRWLDSGAWLGQDEHLRLGSNNVSPCT